MDRGLGLGGWLLLSWPGGSWQNTLKVVLAGLITYLLVLWVLMVWWTYRDIRERTRDPFLQAAAVFVVLVFSLPGLWIYLIGRPKETLTEAYARTLEEEALLQELEDLKACPACRRRVADDFVFCPVCETQLKEPCATCSRPLSYSWTACPYCGRQRRTFALQRQGAAAPVPAPAPAPAIDPALDGPAALRRPARPGPAPTPAPASGPVRPPRATRTDAEAVDTA